MSLNKAELQLTRVLIVVFGIVIVLGLTSCDHSTLYNESENISELKWKETDTLFARFNVTDTSHYHNVYVTSRFSSLYPYSNIYFKYIFIGPSGQKRTEIESFEITDKAGKWLGKGFGDLHSYEFQIINNLPIKEIGEYKIKIVPYMRNETLEGVHDRGVKVSLGQEIF